MIHHGQLETDRLIVRPFRASDTGRLVSLFADARVSRFVDDGTPLSRDKAELWVTRSNENLLRHGYGTGAVVKRDSNEMIGWAGFARPAGLPEEIIYGIAAEEWGKGYGSELLAALVGYSDNVLGRPLLRATVDPANAASIRLLGKQGFELVDRAFNGDPGSHLYIRRRPSEGHAPEHVRNGRKADMGSSKEDDDESNIGSAGGAD